MVEKLHSGSEATRRNSCGINRDSRVTIKLILFFDDLFIADGLIKERILSPFHEEPEQDIVLSNVFMISISDYEILVYLIARNEELFNKIMETKIEREVRKDYSAGVEFEQIFRQFGVEENDYMKGKRLFPIEGV